MAEGRHAKMSDRLERKTLGKLSVFRTFRAVSVGLLIAGLGGCADSSPVEIPFPQISDVATAKDKLLSKEEKDATIRDLSSEHQRHKDSAIQEIEKR